jgi:hypothetical protein
MKFIKSIALACCVFYTACFGLSLLVSGCRTSQQQAAFNTLYSVEHVTVSAYDGYLDLVVTGKVSTNDVPRVSKSFNTFQASFLIALDAAQYNTNALAPASLLVESQDVINLITVIKKDLK